jgi:sugar lactone lactonase YvrE
MKGVHMFATQSRLTSQLSIFRPLQFLALGGLLAAPLLAAAQQTETQSEPQPQAQAGWTQSAAIKGFNFPRGLAVDANGNVYVADWGNDRVVKIAANSTTASVAAKVSKPTAVAVDTYGDVVAAYATSDGYVVGFVVNLESKIFQASNLGSYGFATGGLTFCGTSAAASGTTLKSPIYYTSDGVGYFDSGNLEGTEFSPRISGYVGLVPRGLACDASNNLYIVDGTFYKVWKVTAKGVWKAIGSGYNRPEGVAVDAAGNVFVPDYGNNCIVEVTAAGVQSVVVTGLNGPTGIAVYNGKNAETLYVADAGNNRVLEFEN